MLAGTNSSSGHSYVDGGGGSVVVEWEPQERGMRRAAIRATCIAQRSSRRLGERELWTLMVAMDLSLVWEGRERNTSRTNMRAWACRRMPRICRAGMGGGGVWVTSATALPLCPAGRTGVRGDHPPGRRVYSDRRKEGGEEQAEIPPTYDSIPSEER
ncbi:hypothetical protein BDQ12DRAFT_685575 [Crucibulum laeve]|uniref:Uncharacterized protein n=1 Tax=Crucibulum laeve TaxID=68775 RepID=A0A5C3LYS9_9AGAR|nr:hypothetical protein BDQ12DRAFT_685575 [Crucibulum laeve]